MAAAGLEGVGLGHGRVEGRGVAVGDLGRGGAVGQVVDVGLAVADQDDQLRHGAAAGGEHRVGLAERVVPVGLAADGGGGVGRHRGTEHAGPVGRHGVERERRGHGRGLGELHDGHAAVGVLERVEHAGGRGAHLGGGGSHRVRLVEEEDDVHAAGLTQVGVGAGRDGGVRGRGARDGEERSGDTGHRRPRDDRAGASSGHPVSAAHSVPFVTGRPGGCPSFGRSGPVSRLARRRLTRPMNADGSSQSLCRLGRARPEHYENAPEGQSRAGHPPGPNLTLSAEGVGPFGPALSRRSSAGSRGNLDVG